MGRWPIVVGAGLFVVLMALSGRYGFHRDELYYLDAGRHLQAGYVAQPVLAPLLARLSLALFGLWLPGLRLWAALAAWATVVVAALIARELGGERRPQLFSAIAVAAAPGLLSVDHQAGPTPQDVLAWAAFAWMVARVGRTGDQRWWVPAGLVLGIGLANKHMVGFFALAVVAGLLLSGGARAVLNRWFLLGALVAGVFTVPDLWWQAGHDWAAIAMTRDLNAENGGLSKLGTWAPGQLEMVSLAVLAVWAAGLLSLWRSRRPVWKALAWAYLLLFVVFGVTTGAKVYYLFGAYVYLLPAGFVTLDSWLAARPRRLWVMGAAFCATTAFSAPVVLPVVPIGDVAWSYQFNQALGEEVGWPSLVHTVEVVWRSLPAAERAHAVIFTNNYGEAGAINELGRAAGLPPAVSGHDDEWWWGPGNPAATTVLAIAPGPLGVTSYRAYLKKYFRSVRQVATLTNPEGVHNQEWGGHLYLCTRLRRPWGLLWPQLRHYD